METWDPGLDNGHRCLGEILQTMPADPQNVAPWYVRLLEHPDSPVALAGAVEPFSHDCLHVVLGRGIAPRDEAVVIGLTLGSSRRWSPRQQKLFRLAARHLYQGDYRFGPAEAEIFDFSADAARRMGLPPLDEVDFRPVLGKRLHDIRQWLALDLGILHTLYSIERLRWPELTDAPRLTTGFPVVPRLSSAYRTVITTAS